MLGITKRALRTGLRSAFVTAVVAVTVIGCHTVDDDRIPRVNVYISFPTEAEWLRYGVTQVMQSQRFIRAERVPSDFPYNVSTYTGYGGVLLLCDIFNQPVAYDLSCPVEVSPTVRVYMNEDNLAECPKCHSLYEVSGPVYGTAVAGIAQERGYGLTRYRVGPGVSGEYRIVTR